MEEKKYKTLLTYHYDECSSPYEKENNRLFLCGHNLRELANMHNPTVQRFFKILEAYLSSKKLSDWKLFITPLPPEEEYEELGLYLFNFEFAVPEEEYEKYKRIIFDLAYIRCSNLVGEAYDKELSEYYIKEVFTPASGRPKEALDDSEGLLENRILHTIKYCYQLCESNSYYFLIKSNIPVDEEDYKMRYSKLNSSMDISTNGEINQQNQKQLTKSFTPPTTKND